MEVVSDVVLKFKTAAEEGRKRKREYSREDTYPIEEGEESPPGT